MIIAKSLECLDGQDGFYMDRGKVITIGGATLIGLNCVKTNDIKKTNLFSGGALNDSRSKNQ